MLLQGGGTLKCAVLQGGGTCGLGGVSIKCVMSQHFSDGCLPGILSNWVISCFYRVEEHQYV